MSKKKNKTKTKTKLVFVVGGVMSGVGKGITTASIAKIFSNKGYNVSAIKIDPYINVDAGTMNPIEHGEVFVTDDADETDQDVGNYERFLNKNILKANYMTTGRVYQSVINRERNLEYGGKCVQVVPHIPQEVSRRIKKAAEISQAEIMVIEIGGTVGEYENLLFLEAARMMKLKNAQDILFVIVSYLPIPNKIGEMKTKPTQHAVRILNGAGIQPNFIVLRSEKEIDNGCREKVAIHCNVQKEDIIAAPDADSIYEIPINFEKDDFGNKLLKKLGLKAKPTKASKDEGLRWKQMIKNMDEAKKEVKIGIIGKYLDRDSVYPLHDLYTSLVGAIKHAATQYRIKPKIEWFNAEEIEKKGVDILKNMDGIIMPQDWGTKGFVGKLKAVRYCRENKVPFLGISYGMQVAVIEFARNVCQLKNAGSEELDLPNQEFLFHVNAQQEKLNRKKGNGKSVRLGAWPCELKKGTKLAEFYAKQGVKGVISERHRHHLEFNNNYKDLLEKNNLVFSGYSPDGKIMEAIEIKNHPFFVGVQFNPEYLSRPLAPHPLFLGFINSLKK